METYIAPRHQEKAFHCPHCAVYSYQFWNRMSVAGAKGIEGLWVARCQHCDQYSIWHQTQMIYPFHGTAPLPSPDLPDHIKADYEEARAIVSRSPRGAAALLRLAIQKLCDYLEAKGTDLNEQIGYLVKQGLDPQIQKALDIVRVIGNESVHPGQIDMKDDDESKLPPEDLGMVTYFPEATAFFVQGKNPNEKLNMALVIGLLVGLAILFFLVFTIGMD